MARCGCSGSSCGCLVVGGPGVVVTGVGSATNPFVINAGAAAISATLQVADTTTVNMTMAGSGNVGDPFIISGVATLSMSQLTDVADPSGGPVAGEVPTWVGGGTGHWEYRTPSVAAGAVIVGAGLTGDGTASGPLAANVSTSWNNHAQLTGFGTATTDGWPVYTDVNGDLRVPPFHIHKTLSSARGTNYASRMIYEEDTGLSFIANGTSWDQILTAGTVTSIAIVGRSNVSGVVAVAAGLLDAAAVIRYTLTGNATLTLPDGVAGQAYMVNFDVITGGYTLGITGGSAFTGLSGVSRALVPMFWAGDTWFSMWQA